MSTTKKDTPNINWMRLVTAENYMRLALLKIKQIDPLSDLVKELKITLESDIKEVLDNGLLAMRRAIDT